MPSTKFTLFAAALLASSASPAFAAPVIYNVNAQAGANTVTGTITTNGKIGVLAQDDVTDYSLSFFRDGVSTGTADSSVFVQREIAGSALTASASDLFFDYSGEPGSGFYFASEGFANYFCSNTNAFGCGNGVNNTLTISTSLNESIIRSGVQSINNAVVTAAVPEPATWAMMLVGFGGIGFAMRRRKRHVTTTVAYA